MAAVAAALKKKGFRFPKRKAKSVLEENARNNWQAEIPSESECPRLADLVRLNLSAPKQNCDLMSFVVGFL